MEQWPKNEGDGKENKDRENKKEVEEHLVEVFEKGLEDEECIGYHGTSLEAVEYMLEHGHLPGSCEADSEYGYEKGSLFFYPRKAAFPDYPGSENFFDNDEDAIRDTKVYADIIARFHYIVKALGLDLGNPEHQYLGRVLGEGDSPEAEEIIAKLITERGKTRQEIKDILRDAQKRKGVVISLDKKILEKHKLGAGDDSLAGQDLRVICPEGLDFMNISGLEPAGQEEWDFFKTLVK
jgi:hypothetical protein